MVKRHAQGTYFFFWYHFLIELWCQWHSIIALRSTKISRDIHGNSQTESKNGYIFCLVWQWLAFPIWNPVCLLYPAKHLKRRWKTKVRILPLDNSHIPSLFPQIFFLSFACCKPTSEEQEEEEMSFWLRKNSLLIERRYIWSGKHRGDIRTMILRLKYHWWGWQSFQNNDNAFFFFLMMGQITEMVWELGSELILIHAYINLGVFLITFWSSKKHIFWQIYVCPVSMALLISSWIIEQFLLVSPWLECKT